MGGGGERKSIQNVLIGGGGVMIIQNALIGGFSFNRNALGGGSYQIRGIQNVGGGGTYKSHFISEINYCTCLFQEYTSAKPRMSWAIID